VFGWVDPEVRAERLRDGRWLSLLCCDLFLELGQ
jgi:hypothetical protein